MNTFLKRLLYILVLFAVLGGMVFMTMPVQFMAVQFGLPENVRVGHFAGTVWSGRAVEVVYRGRIGELAAKDTVMDLVWSWCPGWHRGVAAMCVRVESPLLEGEGTLAYSLFDGTFEAHDTRLRVRLSGYPLNIGPLKTQLKGDGDFHFELVSFDPADARLLTDLRAGGELRDLRANEFQLGSYLWRANLEQDAKLTSDFSGGSERFTLKGQASLDLGDRSYRYSADLKTKDRGLFELLKSRAKKSKGNTLTFSGKGKMP